jgi:ParB family transcriptional regulator, chromosome partitioning protein
MGKADELLRSMGGSIVESASHRGAPAAMPTAGAALTSDRLTGVMRSKAALEIPLGKIEPDRDQPREEFEPDALARLAESIRTRGILQPIRVRWDEGRGRYVIIAGERRWRASGMAGMATLPCVVDDRAATPGELLALQLIENCIREDLKPVEQAKAFRALMDLNGWSGNQLSKELGISQSGVVQSLALLALPATVLSAVDSGELAASTAYAIATLADPADQSEVAARAVAEGMSRAEVAAVVKARSSRSKKGRSKGRGAKVGPRKTSVTIRTSSGFKVTIEHRRGVDDEAIRVALIEALGQLDAEQSEAAA